MISSRLGKKIAFRLGQLALVALLFSSALQAAEQKVKLADLSHQAGMNVTKVSEFAEIRREAERRGLRVWALGGAASSFVDHAKHELLGPNYSPRLTWEFNNILLPEQDVDLVLTRADGGAETAQDVDNFLEWVRKKFPYTADGRSRWEAMGLKTTSQNGRKMAVGTDPDFLLQHNDSLSLGMLEITQPPGNESRFRNLGNKTDFVRDIADSQFHFLYQPTHAQTARFRQGLNPPILSVIRALEKATRYNLDVDAESVRVMKQIVAQWDPRTVQVDSYVYNYLHGRGKRVLTHAHDLEEALKLVESVGLKNKLLKLPGIDSSAAESLGWWLNRSPLPKVTHAGRPTGRTAGNLGIRKAYHWSSHANHRLMTWNYDANPRLFQSRENVSGETAVLGKGFYTFANDPANRKYRNTKSADQYVEFEVNPNAREGIDFTYDKGTETVVWKSSEHLKVAHQKPVYPHNLTCSSSFAGLGTSFSSTTVARATLPRAVVLPPLPILVRQLGWKAIPVWMAKNPLKTIIGGIFAYNIGKAFVDTGRDAASAFQSPADSSGYTGGQGGPVFQDDISYYGDGYEENPAAQPVKEDYVANGACLRKLASGPAPECGPELNKRGKDLAFVLTSSRQDMPLLVNSIKVDAKSIDLLREIKEDDKSLSHCVLDLAWMPLDSNLRLSEYLEQCRPATHLPDTIPLLSAVKALKRPITPAEFNQITNVDPKLVLECASLYPADVSPFEGNRISDCAKLSPSDRAKLKPYLEAVKNAHGAVPFTITKAMIDMGPGNAACYAALGDFTKDANVIGEACAKENPSSETLIFLRLAIEKSPYRDWTHKGDEIKKFLSVYKNPESMTCAKYFMGVYEVSPINKEPINTCGMAEISDINKVLPQVLQAYKNNRWSLTWDALERLKSLKTDLARQCLHKVIATNNWYPLHEKVISACSAMTRQENLVYFANALQYAMNNRQTVEDFSGVTAATNSDTLKCREQMAAQGYNAFGNVVSQFCDHEKVVETNKILPQILAFYANNRMALKTELAEPFKLYSTDLARQCGQTLVNTNQWQPLHMEFAKACATMTKPENIPYLARALQYAANNRQSIKDITGITDNPSVDALKCRDQLAAQGYNPLGETAAALCDHAQVAETNKLLPSLLNFYSNNRMTLKPELASTLKLFTTDLARKCATTIIERNQWNPLHGPYAKACAEMKSQDNINYLSRGLAFAQNNRQSVDNMTGITANANAESLKCRDQMGQYGYNAFGPTAEALCDQELVGETNKILPNILAFYANNRLLLKPEYIASLKQYSTDLARECGKTILNTGQWMALNDKFSKACAEMTKKENIPYLRTAFQYAANNRQSVEDISSITAASDPDSLKCREIFAPYGTNPFGTYVKSFCDHSQVAETNRFLPNLLNFISNNRMSLKEEYAPMVKLYTSELARECGQTLMNASKNPLFGKFANSCATVTSKENIRYLATTLNFASNNRQSVEDISAVTAASNSDVLKCQEFMAGYGFNAFGSTVHSYCDHEEVKSTHELLRYVIPSFQSNRRTLPEDQAATLKKYKTAGSIDCLKQTLNEGGNPLSGAKADECLAK